jgi:tetratricopeptide (TPR) repeat protein
MMRIGSLWVAVALAVLSGPLGGMVPHASAQDADASARAQAKEHFQAGVAAYEAQRYGDALTHFQEAYRIKPHPLVRVNMANCYDRLGKPLQAIFHFERFLEESDPNAAQRKEVTDALRGLRGKVSELTLRITPDGASVTIDGGDRRKSPILEPIRLEAGMHMIEVALAGYQAEKRDLVLEGGQRSDVAITLERALAAQPPVVAVTPTAPVAQQPVAALPEAEPAPAEAERPVEEDERPPVAERPPADPDEPRAILPTLGWVSAGASAAMFVGALITGQLALSAESDFEEARDTSRDIAGATPLERRSSYEDALEAADRAEALAVASDIFLVAGIVGVGITTYIAIDYHSGGESSSESARLTVSPTRIAIDGRF